MDKPRDSLSSTPDASPLAPPDSLQEQPAAIHVHFHIEGAPAVTPTPPDATNGPSKESTRRQFLMKAGKVTALLLAGAGARDLIDAASSDKESVATSSAATQPPPAEQLPHQTAAATEAAPTPTEAPKPPLPELKLPTFDYREDYTPEELAEWAMQTEFGIDNPLDLTSRLEKIYKAAEPEMAELFAQAALEEATGVKVYFDTDLSEPIVDNKPTGGTLPQNRPPLEPHEKKGYLALSVKNFATLPKGLLSVADGYHILYNFGVNTHPQTGARSIAGYNGVAVAERDANDIPIHSHVGMLIGDATQPHTPRHELVHAVNMGKEPGYGTQDIYSRYRDEVGAKLGKGNLVDEVSHLQAIESWLNEGAAQGKLDPHQVIAYRDIAQRLIANNRTQPGQIEIEDEAQTFEHTLAFVEQYGFGLLPSDTGNEVVDFYRTKQQIALRNMQDATGVDPYKMAKFNYRFGGGTKKDHPKTAASFVLHGVTNQMYEYDGGMFNQWSIAKQYDRNATLETLFEASRQPGKGVEELEGCLLYNIGTPEEPKLITLKKIFYGSADPNSGRTRIAYAADVSFPAPKPGTVDLGPLEDRFKTVRSFYKPLTELLDPEKPNAISALNYTKSTNGLDTPTGSPEAYAIIIDAEHLFAGGFSRFRGVVKDGVMVDFNPETDAKTFKQNTASTPSIAVGAQTSRG